MTATPVPVGTTSTSRPMCGCTSLGHAYFYVAFLIPVSGLFWLWGSRYLGEDTARAPTLLGGEEKPTGGGPSASAPHTS